MDLHVAVAGQGPPVVLLHGFPEDWRSWRHQLPALVEAGFSVWAPDLRGYNRSGRPTTREAYHLSHLVVDVAAVIGATGHDRAHLVGHDWGGVVAWTLAGHLPQLVDRLVILNAPHMEIFLRRVRRGPQMLRSSYVLFFQPPRLPELVLSAGNFASLRLAFRAMSVRPDAFTPEEIDGYVASLAAPGALTAALDYYRANMGTDGMTVARTARIEAETLVIWGERDPALGLELLDGLEEVAPRVRIRRLPHAGHWVQREEPVAVNRLLAEFLRRDV